MLTFRHVAIALLILVVAAAIIVISGCSSKSMNGQQVVDARMDAEYRATFDEMLMQIPVGNSDKAEIPPLTDHEIRSIQAAKDKLAKKSAKLENGTRLIVSSFSGISEFPGTPISKSIDIGGGLVRKIRVLTDLPCISVTATLKGKTACLAGNNDITGEFYPNQQIDQIRVNVSGPVGKGEASRKIKTKTQIWVAGPS